MPVLSRCAVRLRKIKMVAADNTIPKESRKTLKLNIVSNVFAQNTTRAHREVKTLNEIRSTLLLEVRLANAAGKTFSSLMACITLGLLMSVPFTYAITHKNKNTESM